MNVCFLSNVRLTFQRLFLPLPIDSAMDHVRGCLLYRDKNGKEPVNEYLQDLARQKGKDSRIKLNKIRDYVKALSLYGTTVGEPYMKHLEGEIWELRPIRDRILFVAWRGNKFLLLHHFMKKTQKTPRREIEQAKRNLADFIARSKENE